MAAAEKGAKKMEEERRNHSSSGIDFGCDYAGIVL